MPSAPRRLAAAAMLATVLAMTGCDGGGSSAGDAESAAWTAAGVDEPDLELSTGDQPTLTARIETDLPIDDADDPTGFTDRAAQIIWRTHAGHFEILDLTTVHDGATVDQVTLQRAELEDRFGPRPAGLDGDAAPGTTPSISTFPDDWTALREATAPQVNTELLHPLLVDTARDVFDTDTPVTSAEPEECMTGVNGDRPTGTFQIRSSGATIEAEHPRALIPRIADYWQQRGLDVVQSGFDAGASSISVRFDGVGTLFASAGAGSISLTSSTDCLAP